MKIFYSTLGIDNAIKEQERDNINANQKVNNMLNSTKTWQEDFEQEYWGKFGSTKTISDIKQFISDLRKKDEQQLLLKLSLETQYYGREIEMKISKIIEEYYAKN